MISTCQLLRSAKRVYMRNRSPANSADSSPPVPARISRKMLRSSLGSFGSSCFCSSASIASSRALRIAHFGFGELAHSASAIGGHFLRGMNVAFALQISIVEFDYRRDLRMLARELAIVVHIGGNGFAAQQTVQFFQPHAQLRELGRHAFFHSGCCRWYRAD